MPSIEITLRDMYVKGTDTLSLTGDLAEKFPTLSVSEKIKLIKGFETVSFSNFYISSVRYLTK